MRAADQQGVAGRAAFSTVTGTGHQKGVAMPAGIIVLDLLGPSILEISATSPGAKGSGYYGPNWFYELKGPPAPVFVASQAKDAAAAKRLWDLSEQLTGARWAA